MPAEPEPSLTAPSGLWLPLITPFRNDRIDTVSLRRLVRHYAAQPLDGLILGATTGEGMTIDEDERADLVTTVADTLREVGRRLPIVLGVSGSDTRKVVDAVARTSNWPIDGYLIACPYYTRPSQLGLLLHFEALSEATARPIMIYNIPYRTGVNLVNATMLRLAARANIVGVKDCCADTLQSVDLIRRRPPGFSVLTGEDALFYGALIRGSDGGILASAHVETGQFAAVRRHLLAGDQRRASAVWSRLSDITRLLFAEPSPSPLKHWLWRIGLIDSPQVRLPMVPVSAALAAQIERRIRPARDGGLADPRVPEPAG